MMTFKLSYKIKSYLSVEVANYFYINLVIFLYIFNAYNYVEHIQSSL